MTQQNTSRPARLMPLLVAFAGGRSGPWRIERIGKGAVDRQADLGEAGRSVSGFGVLDGTEQLQPAGDVLVVR